MKLLTLLACFFLVTQISAQKLDYIWITGDDNQLADTTYGGGILDFNIVPPKASYHYRPNNMFTANSSVCDTSGNLLFYTNGCVIAGADDAVLENGQNVNPGNAHTLWCVTYNDGYSGGIQSHITLPLPDSNNIFYLFHKRFTIYTNPSAAIHDKLYYSTIDMNLNNGKGEVIDKNHILMSDTLARGELVAVKHANGKDWWVVTPRRNSNQFYIFRFTKDGIVDTFRQTIGILPDPQGEGVGQMVFSPDGSKLYRTCRYRPVMVYSFDREAGVFTQFDTIHYDYGNQFIGEIMCAISPNNRFLYLSCREYLYQFDLLASNISASQTTIAQWDGFIDVLPTTFGQCQLGPDCKIYIMAFGDTRYYHVIHNPDEPGLACNVEQRGVRFPTPTGASMPSFPNYRLGPLDNPGAPCTPTVGVSGISLTGGLRISIYPNPASEQIVLDYEFSEMSQPRVLFYNLFGQLVLTLNLPNNTGQFQAPISALEAGIYWYFVAGIDEQLPVGKIVIAR